MAKKSAHTSLWSLIDGMQRKLEAAGLEQRVVDAAVTTGIEAMFEIDPPRSASRRRERLPIPGWLAPHLRSA